MWIQKPGKYICLNDYMNMEMYSQKPNQREYYYKNYMTIQLNLRKMQYFLNQQRFIYLFTFYIRKKLSRLMD